MKDAGYDAVIIGGGPGGSTAGTFLALQNKRVLILEREKFPRFHVGESLIPYINDVLHESGVWEKIASAGFMIKPGAEFTVGNSQGVQRFWFGRNLPPQYAETFQVERARFDRILLEHAREKGCEVVHQARVERVSFTGEGASISYNTPDGPVQTTARWIVDASGRDAFLGKSLNLAKTDLGLPKKIATFAHFTGVKRNEGIAEGNITIVRLNQGWFWIIPLDTKKTSVGLVQPLDRFKATGLTPRECFEQVVNTTGELVYRMHNAERVSDYYHASDYTYRHKQTAGPHWILVGDAAGFIDPIFSSGVMLSLKSARYAASEILQADRHGGILCSAQQRRHTRRIVHMTGVFLSMIKMYYNNSAFEVFMNPVPRQDLVLAVNNLVGGNTELDWKIWWKIKLFYLLCRLQGWFRIAPALNFEDSTHADIQFPLKKSPDRG